MLNFLYDYLFPLLNIFVSVVSLGAVITHYRVRGYVPKASAYVTPFLVINLLTYLTFILGVGLPPYLILRPVLAGLLFYPTLEIVQQLRNGE